MNARKNIRVLYFALLREESGKSEESLETEANSASELYEELQRKYDLSMNVNHLKVAINDEFTEWESILNADDIVTFIPPVAGG
jgi:molybdopterin converting factor subunit 1